MFQDYHISQLEIYIDSLKEQNEILLKAIQDGIYDSRSIVGDAQIRMAHAVKELEQIVAEIKAPENPIPSRQDFLSNP